jgi:hypothetical protein
MTSFSGGERGRCVQVTVADELQAIWNDRLGVAFVTLTQEQALDMMAHLFSFLSGDE